MEEFEINCQIAEYMNPYVKLQKIDVSTQKPMLTKEYNYCVINKGDSDNSTNHMIEHMSGAYVMLQRIKLFICKVCMAGFLYADDLQLHSVKHVTRTKSTSFTSYKGRKRKPEFCMKQESASKQNATKEKLGNVQNNSEGTKTDCKKSKAKSRSKKSGDDNVVYRFHGIKKYSCSICKKTLKSRSTLRSHINIHNGVKPHSCDICGKRFTQAGNLRTHINVHNGVKPYSCNICGKKFSQQTNWKFHMNAHYGNISAQCPICNKAFYCPRNVEIHMNIHTGLKPYSCKFCGKDFVDPSALARHERTHTGDKRYACQLCPMRFSDASGYIAHKKKHAGIKTQMCEYCDKKFYTKAELKCHVTCHTGQKDFECGECGKRFSRKEYLRSHIVRLGKHKQLYQCKLCALSSYTKKIVEIHELTHYKYECHACGKKLLSKVLMIQHVESRH